VEAIPIPGCFEPPHQPSSTASRLRGIAGESVTERVASQLFPEYHLTGRQVLLPGGHIADYELLAKDGTGMRRALKVKGWTAGAWRRALEVWSGQGSPANAAALRLAAEKLPKHEARLMMQLAAFLEQMEDAARLPRGKPFLVVTSAMSKRTAVKFAQFVREAAPGIEVSLISEEDVLLTSRRLRDELGLPTKMTEDPK